MNENSGMPRGDFVVSVILVVFSVWVIHMSLTMRRFGELGLAASPGLSPLVFAALLLICGLILLRRSLAQRGYRMGLSSRKSAAFLRAMETRHFVVVLASIVIYYLFLGVVHFVIISAVYVFFIIWYFKGVAWWKNLLISVLSGTIIWFSFDQVFLIPLP
ncbi:MAG: tripartite tricarboxylate transporter TctB family protein [Spirochaetaceae bacterium]|nr:MAG: tripartite tricarboxylate transporter TctB family protein [Spirochaetaceae bacterium]